jgi:hypothetical protein
LILNGSKSLAGSTPVAVTGYTWSLVSRPASSSLIVNGAPGLVERTVMPDVSGVYTFALVVQTAGPPVLYSSAETVLIVVDEVPVP